MSRPLRIEFPNAWYHIMNRGRRSESIFLQDQDYLLISISQQRPPYLLGGVIKDPAFCGELQLVFKIQIPSQSKAAKPGFEKDAFHLSERYSLGYPQCMPVRSESRFRNICDKHQKGLIIIFRMG